MRTPMVIDDAVVVASRRSGPGVRMRERGVREIVTADLAGRTSGVPTVANPAAPSR